MMEDNPYEPLKANFDSAAIVEANRKTHSNFEISHNILRGVFAFIFFGIAPVLSCRGMRKCLKSSGWKCHCQRFAFLNLVISQFDIGTSCYRLVFVYSGESSSLYLRCSKELRNGLST